MEQNKSQKKELLILALGELAVSALIICGYLIITGAFDIKVISGSLLGSLVAIGNYALMMVSVNKAINNYLTLRGEREMSDEEAEKFAAENSAPIQNAIKTSYIIRTLTMLLTLVVAFITGWFNPLATAIPLLVFRPLLSIIEIISKRNAPAPNPENFIKYEDNDEKESDD